MSSRIDCGMEQQLFLFLISFHCLSFQISHENDQTKKAAGGRKDEILSRVCLCLMHENK
jgi:hypothetical protein